MEYTVTITDETGEEHYKFSMSGLKEKDWNVGDTAYILMHSALALEEIPTTVGKLTNKEFVDMMHEEVHKDD